MFNRSFYFKPASLVSANGLKTSVATAASAQSYSGAALNGSMVSSNVGACKLGEGSYSGLAGYPAVTASNSVGSYVNNSTVVFTGSYGGQTVTRTATITNTAGNGTFITDGPLDTVTQIDVQAQANTAGAFTFGWSGVAPTKPLGSGSRMRTWKVVCNVAGNLHCVAGGNADTVPLAAQQEYQASPSRIYADSTVEFTLYESL